LYYHKISLDEEENYVLKSWRRADVLVWWFNAPTSRLRCSKLSLQQSCYLSATSR